MFSSPLAVLLAPSRPSSPPPRSLLSSVHNVLPFLQLPPPRASAQASAETDAISALLRDTGTAQGHPHGPGPPASQVAAGKGRFLSLSPRQTWGVGSSPPSGFLCRRRGWRRCPSWGVRLRRDGPLCPHSRLPAVNHLLGCAWASHLGLGVAFLSYSVKCLRVPSLGCLLDNLVSSLHTGGPCGCETRRPSTSSGLFLSFSGQCWLGSVGKPHPCSWWMVPFFLSVFFFLPHLLFYFA